MTRIVTLVLLVMPVRLGVAAAPVAAAPSAELWKPAVKPTTCEMVTVDTLVFDVSKSMAKDRLLERTKEQVIDYINQSSPCTLLVVARFGVTFDVVTDGFIDDAGAKERLAGAVRALKPNQLRTNLDEAAKGVEWLHFKLLAAYPKNAFVHEVRILTDNISSPSDEKPQFDLRKYLEAHTRDGQMYVVQAQVQAEGTSIEQRDGQSIQVVPVDKVLELLRQSRPPLTDLAQPQAPPGQPSLWEKVPLYAWIGSALFLLAVVALLMVRMLREDPKLKAAKVTPRSGPDVPTSLAIAEYEVPEGNAGKEKLLQEARIPIRANFPAVFGRDAFASAFVVSEHKGLPEHEVFRITAIPGKVLQVRAGKDVRLGDKVISEGGVRLSAIEPFRLRFGRLEWRITPSFNAGRPDSGERLFAVAGAGR
jgi:hypothetical protein